MSFSYFPLYVTTTDDHYQLLLKLTKYNKMYMKLTILNILVVWISFVWIHTYTHEHTQRNKHMHTHKHAVVKTHDHLSLKLIHCIKIQDSTYLTLAFCGFSIQQPLLINLFVYWLTWNPQSSRIIHHPSSFCWIVSPRRCHQVPFILEYMIELQIFLRLKTSYWTYKTYFCGFICESMKTFLLLIITVLYTWLYQALQDLVSVICGKNTH